MTIRELMSGGLITVRRETPVVEARDLMATGRLGMGPAISRSIVEAHGGRLTAGNNQGGGATFSFTVPVMEQE